MGAAIGILYTKIDTEFDGSCEGLGSDTKVCLSTAEIEGSTSLVVYMLTWRRFRESIMDARHSACCRLEMVINNVIRSCKCWTPVLLPIAP
jgi:hypothetical protein